MGREGFVDLMPWAALVSDDVVLMKDGSLLAGWEIQGPDPETLSYEELLAFTHQANEMLRLSASTAWLIHLELQRYRAPSAVPTSWSESPVAELVETERVARANSDNHPRYLNRTALFLSFQPPKDGLRWLSPERWMRGGDVAEALKRPERTLETFERDCRTLLSPVRTLLNPKRLKRSAFVSALYRSAAGEEAEVEAPEFRALLDACLAGADFTKGVRPHFGRPGTSTHREVKVLTIEGLPSQVYPAMLESVAKVSTPCRWASRFLPLNGEEADRHFEGVIGQFARTRWSLLQMLRSVSRERAGETGSDPLIEETESSPRAEEAIRSIQAARVSQAFGERIFGFLTSCVLLYGDHDEVERGAAAVGEALRERSLVVREETWHAAQMIEAMMIGNRRAGVRRPCISSRVATRILPWFGQDPGSPMSTNPAFPEDSPALITARKSRSGDPHWVNFHAGQKAHTSFVGATESGKTVALQATIWGWLTHYPESRVVMFDAKYSSEVFTGLLDGLHVPIGTEFVSDPPFAPLSRIDTEHDLGWAKGWLESILDLQGVPQSPVRDQEIYTALNRLTLKQSSTMTDLVPGMQNAEVRAAIEAYTHQGPYGRLFDGVSDDLGTARFVTYELDQLFQLEPKAGLPALSYLFQTIRRRLPDGVPTLVVIDEAWASLARSGAAAEIMGQMISDWARTLRRYGGSALVLATQTAKDLLELPPRLRASIVDNMAGFVFLPDAAAETEAGLETYAQFGLSPAQCARLSRAQKKRDYLHVWSERGQQSWFDLDLSPLELAVFGNSEADKINEYRALRQEFGDRANAEWLVRRGFPGRLPAATENSREEVGA